MKNLLLIGLLSIMFSFESAAQKKELKYASDFAQLKKQIKESKSRLKLPNADKNFGNKSTMKI